MHYIVGTFMERVTLLKIQSGWCVLTTEGDYYYSLGERPAAAGNHVVFLRYSLHKKCM